MKATRSVLAAVAIAAAFAMPAQAGTGDDYSRIPAEIRAGIKAKCVAENPGDYFLQNGCINLESQSWLKVQDYAPAPQPRIITTADGTDFRNHAYLKVAAQKCALKVDNLVHDYKVRGRMMNGDLSDATIDTYIAGYLRQFQDEARKDRKAFCAQAKKNLPNFVDDISRPLAE